MKDVGANSGNNSSLEGDEPSILLKQSQRERVRSLMMTGTDGDNAWTPMIIDSNCEGNNGNKTTKMMVVDLLSGSASEQLLG